MALLPRKMVRLPSQQSGNKLAASASNRTVTLGWFLIAEAGTFVVIGPFRACCMGRALELPNAKTNRCLALRIVLMPCVMAWVGMGSGAKIWALAWRVCSESSTTLVLESNIDPGSFDNVSVDSDTEQLDGNLRCRQACFISTTLFV